MRTWILIVSLLSLIMMQGLFIAAVTAETWRRYSGDTYMMASFISGIVSYTIVICIVYKMGHNNGAYYGQKSDTK